MKKPIPVLAFTCALLFDTTSSGLAEARPVAAPAAPAAPAKPFVMPVLPPIDTSTPRFVIFKFDDLRGFNNPKKPVHARFQRLADYLDSKELKASFGIIANSLEKANIPYCDWISKHAIEKGGRFEFWFHGYDHAMNMAVDGKTCNAEFSGPDYAYQFEHFTKGCKLMQECVGFPFRTFGAAGNAVDATGLRVLEEHPEIKVWLFGKAQTGSTKFVLTRSPELEHGVGKVSFEAFLKGYTARRTQTCLTLQGHPAMWSDEMFADFQRIVALLQADSRIFLTPYEYYQRNTVSK
jgi:peptidoglycan/xylan/chitin deacetylase (PgdA/CDA1 family)